MERQSSSMEWESPVPTINRLVHRDRCLTSRMGSLLSRDVDRRQVAPRRDFIPYQLPRIASRLTSHNVLHQEQSQGSGTTADGQHFSSNLHKQNERDTLPHAILPSQKSMGLVPHPRYLGDSALHSRNTECRTDRESRVFLDSSDWKLHPGVFNRLHQKWGPLNIDLFASRLSYQLD